MACIVNRYESRNIYFKPFGKLKVSFFKECFTRRSRFNVLSLRMRQIPHVLGGSLLFKFCSVFLWWNEADAFSCFHVNLTNY